MDNSSFFINDFQSQKVYLNEKTCFIETFTNGDDVIFFINDDKNSKTVAQFYIKKNKAIAFAKCILAIAELG